MGINDGGAGLGAAAVGDGGEGLLEGVGFAGGECGLGAEDAVKFGFDVEVVEVGEAGVRVGEENGVELGGLFGGEVAVSGGGEKLIEACGFVVAHVRASAERVRWRHSRSQPRMRSKAL